MVYLRITVELVELEGILNASGTGQTWGNASQIAASQLTHFNHSLSNR